MKKALPTQAATGKAMPKGAGAKKGGPKMPVKKAVPPKKGKPGFKDSEL